MLRELSGIVDMGKIHHLLTMHGLKEAKALTADKLDRQCIDAAFAVLTDEQQRIGIMHAGFSMTALPHKDITETVWVRQGGSVKLRIESGIDANDRPVGVPFGSIA